MCGIVGYIGTETASDIIIDTTKKILDEEISAEKHDALLKKAVKDL